MGRYLGPRTKICRRLGFMIYENSNVEKAFLKREQETFRRKQSEYGRRLLEKQKVMYYYGMREGQMRKFFNLARRTKGNTSKAFLIACERRLDNAVHSAGFAASRAQARQLICHGNVRVNGKRVDIASFMVGTGDAITISERTGVRKVVTGIVERKSGYAAPDWIAVDPKNLVAKVVRLPVRDDVRLPVNEQLLVEFFSR
ncbi:MAG: 30S ribosomal protein S4 [Planctomycetota bacterium]|jgi:small subunit ribosomal protein S4|nr:30S ribosomal protein S4 [Planctomycetota bacterium]